MLQAFLEGLTFEGGEGEATYDIAPDGLRGWFEGVSVRTDRTPRPSAHGFFPGTVLRGGRTIVLKGKVHSRSPEEQEHDLSQLTGLLGDGQVGRFSVQTRTGLTWADVQLDDAPEVTMLIYGALAEYRLQLWAPDPIRYGEVRTFQPGDAVYHRGNAPSFPIITVKGPTAPYAVSAAGKSFPIAQAMTAGQTHTIDLKTGAVHRNGVRQLGVATAAVRWSVPPGVGVVHTVSGTGAASIALPDASN